MALKTAREARGLSQRELSAKSGVPQSHISKIEQGSADIRVSSMLALARALDLEPMFVPRKYVPAVEGMTREATRSEVLGISAARAAASANWAYAQGLKFNGRALGPPEESQNTQSWTASTLEDDEDA
ncbi:helix-turn-helix domain-containing protein [Microvirga puerhi]|uniref:Helix-turn-helix transcriptional regulator n=1 Tax=Microvirga puerhi TaxID=2876078 RepID=A0ABS7VVL0_9HYPH|nr:helix-turn-helix transcriptional regulator [Microvirga puerhi]